MIKSSLTGLFDELEKRATLSDDEISSSFYIYKNEYLNLRLNGEQRVDSRDPFEISMKKKLRYKQNRSKLIWKDLGEIKKEIVE